MEKGQQVVLHELTLTPLLSLSIVPKPSKSVSFKLISS